MVDTKLNKKFISFEGIDFSGKSTQISLLKTYLEKNNQDVFILREPGGTEISERIRSILLDKKYIRMHDRAEILLFSAARVQLTYEKIIPLLNKGKYVIADRFVDSTTAYQGYGRELELELVDHVNKFATLGILPGITFYLKINPDDAFKRRLENGLEADRLESSGENFYKRVCQGYESIARKNPKRFNILDATQDKGDIHRQIINIIKDNNGC